VTLDRISYPPDGHTLLEGMTLADPETGDRIAHIPALELARDEGELSVVATRPEIHAERAHSLWDVLHDRVLRERGVRPVPIHFMATQATMTSEQSETLPTFTDLDVQLAPGKASIDFRIAGVEMNAPIQFRATRERSGALPETHWVLHTGEAAVPCVLFVRQLPWLSHLGDACRFSGSVWLRDGEEGWRGELTGHFTHIDLVRLVSEQFPHQLGGQAKATITRAEFNGGRLHQLSGTLEAGPGVIGQELLVAAVETLKLRYTEPVVDVASLPLVEYNRMAFGFDLDETGLRIAGANDEAGSMLVLKNSEARILDNKAYPSPAASLIHILAPSGEVQVPATQEAETLLRFLPLSLGNRSVATPSARPEAHVRMAR
jgi:hypothetical protein